MNRLWLLLFLVLAACGGPKSIPVVVEHRTDSIKPIIVARPSPVLPMRGIEPMIVITEDEKSEPRALLCFSTQDRLSYETWIQDMIRWMRQASGVLNYYEETLAPPEKVVTPP